MGKRVLFNEFGVSFSMSRHASKHAPHSSRRPRAAMHAYPPNWRPGITVIHGTRDGNHVLVDVVPYVVEHAGGINKEGMQFFRMCRDAADSKFDARASEQAALLVQQEVL